MSRAVARVCATPNESRVALVNLADEMETREQQLLHTTSLLRPTLKNLHNFMVGRMAEEAENPAFYAYYTQNVHQSVLRHLTESIAQLTAMEDILSIDKFITDVASFEQDAELKTRRRTMCAKFAVTATTMDWPMHQTLGISS